MPGSTDAGAVTTGRLLGGRVRYDQLASGHRSGIEPVFLAAAVPARPGQRVLEAGTGAGAALLCLAFRVPGVVGRGVEIDPALCALAAANFALLDAAGLHAVSADITAYAGGAAYSGGAAGCFDHGFANPPWHDAAGTASPDAGRERARRAAPGLLDAWLGALAHAVRPGGTVTLVAAVAAVPDFLGALAPCRLGSPVLLPLWPRAGTPAKLVLMQAVRDGRATLRLLPGMVLHAADGRYTAEATAVLRDAAAVPLGVSPGRSRRTPGTARAARCIAPVPRP